MQLGETTQPLISVIKVIVETEIRDYRHCLATFCDTPQARHSRNASARATPSEHQVHNPRQADRAHEDEERAFEKTSDQSYEQFRFFSRCKPIAIAWLIREMSSDTHGREACQRLKMTGIAEARGWFPCGTWAYHCN